MLATVVMGTLAVIAASAWSSYAERVKVGEAQSDITLIETRIEQYQSAHEALPTSLAVIGEDTRLDPWGHPYQYLDFTGLAGQAQMRKDRNLVPINGDYDLYSLGEDGKSLPPLLAPVSQDDVIRANNGGYVGLASSY